MRNKTLARIIIATLLCALLVNTGRATRVFALAQPIESIEPIYDTEIFALKDYVEQNLDNPQLDIFFLLGGALAVAQLGAQDAMLESPYPNETSVKEWLINCGIQLYNALIGLVPSGDYYINIPLVGQPQTATKGIPRSMIKGIVAQLMGDAVVARNYSSVDDYLDDDNRPDMPLDRDAQISINAIWQLQGGPFQWQFDEVPFTSDVTWNQISSKPSGYSTSLNNMPMPHVRFNPYDYWGSGYLGGSFFETYHNIWFDSSMGVAKLVNDAGQTPSGFNCALLIASEDYRYQYNASYTMSYRNMAYDSSIPLVQTVRALYNSQYVFTNAFPFIFYEDFVDHVYEGSTWLNKHEIFNVQGLNIAEDMNPYYRSPDSDVFFDIKDMIENLVNKTSIWDFFLDHLFDIDGNLIIPNFPTFSVDLTPITDLLAPPIPVDLNDIALYTDNDYLEEVKERSRKFGETIGEYFVFWHNADPVTVYVIFGSFIVILVGAFIGKWGHS